MTEILVTGGAGFFGGILKRRLLSEGHRCVSIDLQSDDDLSPNLTSIQGDIRDRATIDQLFVQHQFTSVFHCAAILAHAKHAASFLWSSNVEGTRIVAEAARQHHAERIVFTSSNCLWGQSFAH